MNAAAIDLGTNSIKIVIVRRNPDGHMQVLFRHRSVVRLGEGSFSVDSPGKIPKFVQDRTIKVLQSYSRLLEAYKVDVVRAAGTAALRDAKNGAEFIREVREKTGITLEVLPGDDEAKLIAKGVTSEYPVNGKQAVLVDIGGGSCEITFMQKKKIESFTSLPLGAVRLTEMFLKGGKKKPEQIKKLRLHVRKILKSNWPNPPQAQIFLGSAGTIRALGRLVNKTELTDNDRSIESSQLVRAWNKISRMSTKAIAALPGIDSKRAEIIVAGTATLTEIFEHFKIKEMLISGRGLREGVLLELFERPQKPQTLEADLLTQEQLNEIDQFARKYRSNRPNCDQIRRLSLQLFDELQAFHGMPKDAEMYLSVASLLHDVGRFVSESSYHKHTYYLIKNSTFSFLTEKQKNMIASIARYHRKSAPRNGQESWDGLTGDEKKQVSQLASLLRISFALSSAGPQVVRWLKCQWGPGRVMIRLDKKPDIRLDDEMLKDHKKLFETLYNVQVEVSEADKLNIPKSEPVRIKF